jgi:hypothetical protein
LLDAHTAGLKCSGDDTTATHPYTSTHAGSGADPDGTCLRTRTDIIPIVVLHQFLHLSFIFFTFPRIIQRVLSALVRIVVALFVVLLLLFVPDCRRVVERRGVPENDGAPVRVAAAAKGSVLIGGAAGSEIFCDLFFGSWCCELCVYVSVR